MNGQNRSKNTSRIQLVFYTLLTLLIFQGSAVPLEWIAWSDHPRVALTFDDGPHPESTLLLCDILESYRVPATFFIVGSVAVNYPELLHQMVESGHELANHTWSHLNIRFLSEPAMRRDLDRTRILIESITGRSTYLFRTPGGTEKYIRQNFKIPSGYNLVLWDVHSLDQEGISADQIAKRVLANVKSGDVVLMHNGLGTTRDSLKIIIPALQERGYEFVTISELLKDRSFAETIKHRNTFVQG